MPDFTKLWDKKYLFSPGVFEFVRSDYIFFWSGVIFFLLSMALKIFASKLSPNSPKARLIRRFFNLFLTAGILILLWSGARYENIPLLSTHIVALVLYLIFLVWLGVIAKYFWKNYPREQQTWEEELLKRRYLQQK